MIDSCIVTGGWLGESPRPHAGSNKVPAIQWDIGSVGIGSHA